MMTDRNRNHDFTERDGDTSKAKALNDQAFDRELDAALAKYAAAEPRAGLEERILASLRAGREMTSSRPWWRWSFAAAALVVLVAIMLTSRWETQSHPYAAYKTPAAAQSSRQSEALAALSRNKNENDVSAHPRKPNRAPNAARASIHRFSAASVAITKDPKLDHFPSHSPPTDEELALALYVTRFPSDAKLIAQAQQEFEIEAREKMAEPGTENQRSSPINQER